jgi:hypothetical protein
MAKKKMVLAICFDDVMTLPSLQMYLPLRTTADYKQNLSPTHLRSSYRVLCIYWRYSTVLVGHLWDK